MQQIVDSEKSKCIMLFAFCLMAFGLGGFKFPLELGFLLGCLIALLTLPSYWRQLLDNPIFWIVVTFCFFMLLQSHWFASLHPDFADEHWDRARRLVRLLSIPFFSYWFFRVYEKIDWIILAFLLGLLSAFFASLYEWGSLYPLWDGQRVAFRINPQWMSFACGASLFGVLFYFDKLKSFLNRFFSLSVSFTLIALLVFILFQALIASQARMALLGWLLLLVCIIFVSIFRKKDSLQFQWRFLRKPLSGFLILIVFALAWQKDHVFSRWQSESDVIVALVNDEAESTRFSSISIRYALWVEGLEAFKERPFFGWGPDGARYIIRNIEEHERLRRYSHFHNSYIDLLVRYGVFGFILLGSLVGILFWALCTQCVFSPSLSSTLLWSLIYFLIVNITESFLVPSWGIFFFILLASLIGSCLYCPTKKILDFVEKSR